MCHLFSDSGALLMLAAFYKLCIFPVRMMCAILAPQGEIVIASSAIMVFNRERNDFRNCMSDNSPIFISFSNKREQATFLNNIFSHV